MKIAMIGSGFFDNAAHFLNRCGRVHWRYIERTQFYVVPHPGKFPDLLKLIERAAAAWMCQAYLIKADFLCKTACCKALLCTDMARSKNNIMFFAKHDAFLNFL